MYNLKSEARWKIITSSTESDNEATSFRKILSKEPYVPSLLKKDDKNNAEVLVILCQAIIFTVTDGCILSNTNNNTTNNFVIEADFRTENDVKWVINSFSP